MAAVKLLGGVVQTPGEHGREKLIWNVGDYFWMKLTVILILGSTSTILSCYYSQHSIVFGPRKFRSQTDGFN